MCVRQGPICVTMDFWFSVPSTLDWLALTSGVRDQSSRGGWLHSPGSPAYTQGQGPSRLSLFGVYIPLHAGILESSGLLQPQTLNSIFLSKPSALNLPKHAVQVTNLISAPNHTEDSRTQQRLRSQKEAGASGKAGTHANTLSSWPDNTILASRATLKGSSPIRDHGLIWKTWTFLFLYLALSNHLLLYNLNTTPLGSNATQTILPPVFTLRSTSLELFSDPKAVISKGTN